MTIIDPVAAQQELDNTEGLSPNRRRAAEEEISEVRANYEQMALRAVEKDVSYVTETTARISKTYADCQAGYGTYSQWLRDTEPTAKEARDRLEKLHREEINMNRLAQDVNRAAESSDRIKADPVGYIIGIRKKYPAIN